jgi:hypothetical protein
MLIYSSTILLIASFLRLLHLRRRSGTGLALSRLLKSYPSICWFLRWVHGERHVKQEKLEREERRCTHVDVLL